MKWTSMCFLLVSVGAFAKGVPFRASKVSDGDTFRAVLNGQEERIRLICIDAPEKDQPFGDKARQFLETQLKEPNLLLEIVERDPYGRILGFVHLPGIDLNRRMVEEGYAWNYDLYCGTRYQALEDQARLTQRGLWIDPNPINPYVWRQTHFSENQGD